MGWASSWQEARGCRNATGGDPSSDKLIAPPVWPVPPPVDPDDPALTPDVCEVVPLRGVDRSFVPLDTSNLPPRNNEPRSPPPVYPCCSASVWAWWWRAWSPFGVREVGDAPTTTGAVLCAALVALAIGLRTPQRLATWICAMAWHRFVRRGTGWGISALAITPDRVDRPLHWVVLSILALGAGIATLLLPLCAPSTLSAHEWLVEHFFWSPAPLAMMRWTLVFAALLPPLAMCGLAAGSAHHLNDHFGRWNPEATARVLVGAGAGVALAAPLLHKIGPIVPTLYAAALPVLFVALCSAGSKASLGNESRTATEASNEPLPAWVDRWPMLLRATIVALAGATACTACAWHGFLTARSDDGHHAIPAALLVAMGIGFVAGYRVRGPAGQRSIGGMGVACGAAGLITATGSVGLHGASSLGGGTIAALACTGLASLTFAAGYGHQTLLARVANRSAIGATLLARMLIVGGIAAWPITPALIASAGLPVIPAGVRTRRAGARGHAGDLRAGVLPPDAPRATLRHRGRDRFGHARVDPRRPDAGAGERCHVSVCRNRLCPVDTISSASSNEQRPDGR